MLYEMKSKKLTPLSSGCVGMGMLDDLPFVNEAMLKLDEPSKLFCYTDGLVEVIQDAAIETGTDDLEREISNSDPLEGNIQSIIEKQKILEGSASIFDDISIIGAEFPGENGFGET